MSTTTQDKPVDEITSKLREAILGLEIYKLYFARGINPRCELTFHISGGLQEAIKRSREHCDRMNYKFIRCEPFLVNLDEVEKKFEREN